MAISDAYATALEYRAVSAEISADDDTVIDRDLNAITRWLEHKLGRQGYLPYLTNPGH